MCVHNMEKNRRKDLCGVILCLSKEFQLDYN